MATPPRSTHTKMGIAGWSAVEAAVEDLGGTIATRDVHDDVGEGIGGVFVDGWLEFDELPPSVAEVLCVQLARRAGAELVCLRAELVAERGRLEGTARCGVARPQGSPQLEPRPLSRGSEFADRLPESVDPRQAPEVFGRAFGAWLNIIGLQPADGALEVTAGSPDFRMRHLVLSVEPGVQPEPVDVAPVGVVAAPGFDIEVDADEQVVRLLRGGDVVIWADYELEDYRAPSEYVTVSRLLLQMYRSDSAPEVEIAAELLMEKAVRERWRELRVGPIEAVLIREGEPAGGGLPHVLWEPDFRPSTTSNRE